MVRYIYDAWGNHAVLDVNGNDIEDMSHIGNVNPFRYRGYYYDVETGFYYLKSRYYDPETGRFISQDSIDYADPESINGLNLYAYCGNNPIMYTDPNGTAKWWEWLLGLAIIVLSVVVSVLTAGLATPIATALGGGLTATIIGGATAGAISCAVLSFGMSVGGQSITKGADNINWQQVGLATLSGAITGAFLGGISGANGWYNAKALEFTHNLNSKEVVLGRSGVYEKLAIERGATYFKMPDAEWAKLSKNSRVVWNINKAFLKQQISLGKTFIMASDPTSSGGFYFMKEVAYLIAKNIKWIF